METVADSKKPDCTRPGCCAPGTPQQVTAVRIERELAHSKRDQARADRERADVVTVLGQYLFDQVKAYPQLGEWVAGDLIAHLVRVGKQPDMPGAIRVLCDVVDDVEAIVALDPPPEKGTWRARMLTPADPPSPPASPTTTGGATPRRRWWSR
jgi:hypothetical protein